MLCKSLAVDSFGIVPKDFKKKVENKWKLNNMKKLIARLSNIDKDVEEL